MSLSTIWRIIRRQKTIKRISWAIVAIIILAVLFAGVYFFDNYGGFTSLSLRYPQISFVRNVPKIFDIFYLPYYFMPDKVDRYYLIIDNKDFEKLSSKLPQPKWEGKFFKTTDRLTSKNQVKVKAKFIADGKEYKVKVNYRGGHPGHWANEKKSWRIKFTDELFKGKSSINLIIPEDRGNLAEEFNNYRAKKMGLFVPESRFVNLRINGRNFGLYWEVEQWSKEMIERGELRSDTNLYGERNNLDRIDNIFKSSAYWKKYLSNPYEPFDSYGDLEKLIKIINHPDDDYFFREIGSIVDLNNFYLWDVHQILSASHHQESAVNNRLYFDIEQGKFQFIPWDVLIYDYGLIKSVDFFYNHLIHRILQNDELRHNRDLVLWEYVKEEKNLKEDLAYYDRLLKQIKPTLFKDMKKVGPNYKFLEQIRFKRMVIEQTFNNLKELIKETGLSAKAVLDGQKTIREIKLDLTLSSHSAVGLDGIEFEGVKEIERVNIYRDNGDGKFNNLDRQIKISEIISDRGSYLVKFDPETIYSGRNWEKDWHQQIDVLPKTTSFFIRFNRPAVFDPDDFQLKPKTFNQVTGKKVKPSVKNVYYDSQELSMDISPSELADKYDFFNLSGQDLTVVTGTHLIFDDIIIPKGLVLHISPGTVLKFAAGKSLISFSPVKAIGVKEQPIVITGIGHKPWGTFTVIGSKPKQESRFDFVNFSNGSQSYINQILSTGMLAVHFMDAKITNSTFSYARGDDALNVKRAEAEVINSYFHHNSADAIDFDFVVAGEVKGNKFIDNGDDSIDISGSTILIEDNFISESGDKGISAGEKSLNTVIYNNVLSNGRIGIEIKDLSDVDIINNVIIGHSIGLNAYQKKDFFGGGRARVYNSIIWDNEQDIQVDQQSEISVYHSDFAGAKRQNNNFDILPVFTDPFNQDFTISPENDKILFINGGQADILKEKLGIKLKQVPVGLNKGESR